MLDHLNFNDPPQSAVNTGAIWFKVLSSPSVGTFKQLLSQTDAHAGRAIFWLFLSGGFSGLIAGMLQTILPASMVREVSSQVNAGQVSSGAILWSFIFAVLLSIGLPLAALVNTGLIQIIIRLFGGKTSFSQLLFAYAAYQAPLVLILSLVAAVPLLSWLCPLILVYWLLLAITATTAASGLKTGKAFVCLLSPLAFIGVLGVCAVVMMLTSVI